MKTCTCGGMFYLHGTTRQSKVIPSGKRYRCCKCGTSITVRGGEISTLRGRPAVRDWRFAA